MFKVTIFLLLIAGISHYTEAICGVCNENNGVACISKTAFHPCFGGQPNTTMTFECQNPDEICTKHGPVCMDATLTAGLQAACGDLTNCGKCENTADGFFTCTSRTTFTMCMDGNLSEVRLTCPEYEMCDVSLAAQGQYPCVAECKEDTISFCDLKDAVDAPPTTTPATTTTTEVVTTIKPTEDPITTTTPEGETPTVPIPTYSPIPDTTTVAPPTTTPIATEPIPTQNPADALCSQQSAVGRYPYPNENTCRRYVYCYQQGGIMHSNTMNCPGEFYFNPTTTLCGEEKPSGCV